MIVKGLERRNKANIDFMIINESSSMKCMNSMINTRSITFHKIMQHDFVSTTSGSLIVKISARMGETSMNEIIPNNQSILEIDFDWTSRNESGRLTF